MKLCSKCKGDTVVPIVKDGKRVGSQVCPQCGGSGQELRCPTEDRYMALQDVAAAAAAILETASSDPSDASRVTVPRIIVGGLRRALAAVPPPE